MNTSVGMIAHDVTGALDSIAAFVKMAGDTRVLLTTGKVPDGANNIVVVAETQSASSSVAYEEVRRAARRLADRRLLFKRVGSTLRGNIGCEIRALLDETGRKAVVCSALPREGRTLVDGIGRLNSVPLHLTEYALDPTVPCRESSLPAILRSAGIEVSCIPLDVVRGGADVLSKKILQSAAEAVVVDAETDDDMRVLGHVTAQLGDSWCACASSGLSPHLAEALGGCRVGHQSGPDSPGASRVLAVIGTTNPVSAAQVRQLRDTDNVDVILVEAAALCTAGAEVARWKEDAIRSLKRGRNAVMTTSLSAVVPHLFREVAPNLGALAAEVAARGEPSTILVSGGLTALYTCTSLGIPSLEVLGEIEPGVVSSRGLDATGVFRTIVGKAGGFGAPDALSRLVGDRCHGR